MKVVPHPDSPDILNIMSDVLEENSSVLRFLEDVKQTARDSLTYNMKVKWRNESMSLFAPYLSSLCLEIVDNSYKKFLL